MRTLRPLAAPELVVGRVLPGPILDGQSQVLVHQGEKLTARHVRDFRARGFDDVFADRDWPDWRSAEGDPNADPDELVQALQRQGPWRKGSRLRRHKRREWRMQIQLTLTVAAKGLVCRRELSVETCDVSAGGFSFLVGRFVPPGTVVSVRFDVLPNRPVMSGIVRTCVYVQGRQHRVGVEFQKPGSDAKSTPA